MSEDRAAEPLSTWSDRLEAVIASTPACCVDRVVVVAETASTQDAGVRLAGGRPGLLLVAGDQVLGRGRHGRRWSSGPLGLAATFVVGDDGREAGELAMAVGVGVLDAVEPVLRGRARPLLKRPNDVVVADGGHIRKLAGVLIERRAGMVLVGVGVNVRHGEHDWPESLRPTAVSLRQLGGAAGRLEVCELLIPALTGALCLERAALDGRVRARAVEPPARVPPAHAGGR